MRPDSRRVLICLRNMIRAPHAAAVDLKACQDAAAALDEVLLVLTVEQARAAAVAALVEAIYPIEAAALTDDVWACSYAISIVSMPPLDASDRAALADLGRLLVALAEQP